ncbi:MAG: hypothetical protein LBN33_03585 [Desulfovibrio sp.]|jgi:hypothetical protein|nr:hypothetical protein [Desulfovibrio sp.]
MSGYETVEKIRIPKPQAGQAVQIGMRSGQTYLLDFEFDAADVQPGDRDVRISFDDGAILFLKGFFPALDGGDFALQLPDGALLSGKDMAEALTLVVGDFHPEQPCLTLDPAILSSPSPDLPLPGPEPRLSPQAASAFCVEALTLDRFAAELDLEVSLRLGLL